MSTAFVSRDQIFRALGWLASLGAMIALVAWCASRPDVRQLQREDTCKTFGYTDAASLAKCRQSQVGVDAVIAPTLDRWDVAEVAKFNAALAQLSPSKTLAPSSGYQPISLYQLDKLVPQYAKGNKIPYAERRYRVEAILMTNTPDYSDDKNGDDDSDSDPEWRPLSYELWPMDLRKFGPKFLPLQVDIESLNRYERKFVQEKCGNLILTPCHAVVYGHVGPIHDLGPTGLVSVGLIVDQLDIRPVLFRPRH